MNNFGFMMGIMPGAGIGNMPAMTSPTAGPLTEGVVEPGQENFVDLLSLAEDLTIVEEHHGVLDEAVAQALDGFKGQGAPSQQMPLLQQLGEDAKPISGEVMPKLGGDPSTLGKPSGAELLGDAKAVLGSDAILSSVGQKGEAFAASQLSMSELEGQATAMLQESQGLKASGMADEKSVAAWSVPILADELESVSIEKRELPAQQALQNQVQREQVGLSGLESLSKGEISQDAASKLGQMSVQSSGLKQETVEGAKTNATAAFNEAAKEPVASDFKTQELEQINVPDGEKADVLKKEAINVGQKNQGAQKASEFLLGQQVMSRVGENTQPVHSSESIGAVESASQLGEAGDTRIRSEAIKFVSDRIDAIRANGGGQLNVTLNPKSLGKVELKVSKLKQGELNVEIKTEKQEAHDLLSKDLDQLKKNLGASSRTSLSLTHEASGNEVSRVTQLGSSETLNLNGVRGNEARAMNGVMSPRDSGGSEHFLSMLSSSKESESSEQGMGSSRDEAFNKWKELVEEEEKESA